MKKLMFPFFALFFFSTSLIALEDPAKVYLNQENIFFDQGQIFLDTCSGPVLLNSIRSDKNGIYASLEENKWPWTPFQCTNCGRFNNPTNYVCEYCGTPRPD